MNNELVNEKGTITGKVRVISRDVKTGEEIVGEWSKNIILFSANHGKDLVLRRLAGDNTYSLNLTYLDIGTSSTTPAITDTQLGAAVARAALSSYSISSNVLSVLYFFADANLANGTYNEAGTFVDGTSSVNTGQMFNHALFASAYVKAAGKDTTIQVDITIT